MIVALRSLAFVAPFYAWSVVLSVAYAPLMLCPRGWLMAGIRVWARGVIVMLRVAGVRVEVHGPVPTGRVLIAAKHQCMFDVFAQFAWLPDPCFVMRKELMRIPFVGGFARKTGMIVVDREGGAQALRDLVRDAKARLAEDRQLIIFPEGHRGEPGHAGDYHPGVAALYAETGLAAHPLATNSGVHWPAHGFLRRPGTIVFEFLEPIPPRVKRREFMNLLEQRIETASTALLDL